MKKNSNNLVKQCLAAYELTSANKLAEETGIPYTTLNKWENEGPSSIGELLLKALIENVGMKKNIRLLVDAEETKISALQELKKLF